MNPFDELRDALGQEISANHLSGQRIQVRCKALSAKEAIGTPEHEDYPIIKGREVMVEAEFGGAKGQAFADAYEEADYSVDDLMTMALDSNRRRASFIAGLNAVYRYLNLCDKTVHCRDAEPLECASHVAEAVVPGQKVLLVGHQPRFLEKLSAHGAVRAVDMDEGNIGTAFSGVVIEPPEMTEEAIDWCDTIFATGSTLVNGSLPTFLNRGKPVVFYGVTVSAAARILNLNTYCRCGH
ncbi:Rossmann-like domain-containing protein [Desulfoluna spongiiphila]|uniref:Uncharacterized conserved protein, contains DUF4213 and DUF364 domains n=1 Tax=Desulfoluna spongiiphila TaxID=419481 RepID=A0A1G5GFH4_9BACT|nr:DUF364 domain-containing protein [Desulfoluna spongiiphila]SCY49448.1 Uncharacterized conserved protein, contains DUF4213 and DUF364 domains [Desulfoluna spongiiphila]VVS93630.1 putative heavy-metal chelation domain [Desulfoluna spongiiphila]